MEARYHPPSIVVCFMVNYVFSKHKFMLGSNGFLRRDPCFGQSSMGADYSFVHYWKI